MIATDEARPGEELDRSLELDAEAVQAQVDRILASPSLKGSHTLHRLLRFIVQAKLEGREEEIKESVLATDVFGRKPDFDNRTDPVVRVQAYRLRHKLAEYYEDAGAQDSIIIDVPKGSYVPSIAERRAPAQRLAPAPGRPSALWLAAVAAALLLALAAGYSWGSARRPAAAPALPPLNPSVRALWEPFLAPGAAPTSVVFTVPAFLSNEKVLLRYDGPFTAPTGAGFVSVDSLSADIDRDLLERIGPVLFNRTYASLGQVHQIHRLTELFTAAGRTLELKPSRLVSSDEGERRNLILLNGQGLELVGQSFKHFQMRTGSFGYKSPDQPAILNLEAAPGEKAEYLIEFDPATQERRADYAVFAILPGRKPHLRVAYTDGLTTLGNWGAVRALTSEGGIRDLEALLGSPLPDTFEGVVRAEIEQDQITGVSVVAARAH